MGALNALFHRSVCVHALVYSQLLGLCTLACATVSTVKITVRRPVFFFFSSPSSEADQGRGAESRCCDPGIVLLDRSLMEDLPLIP